MSEPHLVVRICDDVVTIEPVGELDEVDQTLLDELRRVIPQLANAAS